jgi:hypothetical protein
METFNLEISYPLIIKAPQQVQLWLENIFKMQLVSKMLSRFSSNHYIVYTEDKGPVLNAKSIQEQDLNFILKNVIPLIDSAINRSSINKYISKADAKVNITSNFDELVKKLPELKGIF